MLRHGVEMLGRRRPLDLAQFRPALTLNPVIQARYDANRLRVLRPGPPRAGWSPTCRPPAGGRALAQGDAHRTMSRQALASERMRRGLREVLPGPGRLYEALHGRWGGDGAAPPV